jgi:hypothetical protein
VKSSTITGAGDCAGTAAAFDIFATAWIGGALPVARPINELGRAIAAIADVVVRTAKSPVRMEDQTQL